MVEGRRQIWWGLIVGSATVLTVSASPEAREFDATNQARNVSTSGCRVESADPDLRLLCERAQFLTEMGRSLERGKDRPRSVYSRLRLVERVWRGDRSLAAGIPWERYAAPNLRLALALMISWYSKAGHSTVSVKELREFSKWGRAEADAGRASILLVVQLVGDLGTPGEGRWLLEQAVKQKAPVRIEAIEALGRSCDPAAGDFLSQLGVQQGLSKEDAAAIEYARKILRSAPQQAFCRSAGNA